MEEALQVCRNCRRRIVLAHLALHEAHCLQFLVLCPECKEPVPQTKMDEHREAGHQQVGCAMCQQSVQKHTLELHESTECQERPTACQFCQLAVRLSKLELHQRHCGNQTKLCPECGQVVTLRGLAQHRDTCRSEPAPLSTGKRSPPEKKIHCHYCNQEIPESVYFHHKGKCCAVSECVKYFPVGKPTTPSPAPPSQPAEDLTSSEQKDVRPKMKNRSTFPLLSENSTKLAPSSTNKTMDRPLKSEHDPGGASPAEDEAAYDILRRCVQCGILLPLPTLNQHQEKCWRLASWKGKPSVNFQPDLKK
ncbi:PREDICTED: XIAP-associated factor 1 [Condylura cristata]|uniref:XIAP-associated factor 1 n=1 Tax=Condylura cristata TaxID=143302 RepID=UPI000643381A|nr:PREDICTED: XIAP-associated factor 1 [Condylura cristata]